MKLSKIFLLFFPFVMLGIPWIYLAYIWKDLPQTVATHFGLDGSPDKFGDKSEVILKVTLAEAPAKFNASKAPPALVSEV